MQRKNMDKLKEKILKNFKCLGCGHCCELEGGYVYARPEEAERIAKYLGLDMVTFLKQNTLKENGWLILSSPRFKPACFLDKNKCCQIYEVRPKNCRTYPDWFSVWKNYETFLKETEFCPGLKRAYDGLHKIFTEDFGDINNIDSKRFEK
ncbi:YkgJ family cysteine cluster protein [bacterium]|jgi:uncharacterized protein|nr:YkgJ family cysteine cluster protein [bacterium]